MTFAMTGTNRLSLSPNTLTLNAPTRTSGSVAVTALADYLDFKTAIVPANTTWLSIAPSEATTPVDFRLNVSLGGLTPRTAPYEARIDFYDTSLTTYPLNVRLNYSGSLPTLVVQPDALSFQQQRNSSVPGPTVIDVRASDGSSIPITATSNAQWLAGSVSSFTPGALTVQLRPATLEPRIYDGTITLSSIGATNSPLSIPVHYEIVDSVVRSIAQIATGGDFVTTLTLLNNDSSDAPYAVRFRTSNGSDATLPTSAGSHPMAGVIPRGGSRTIQTDSIGNTISGWAAIDTERNIGGTAVYRWRQTGRRDQEAAVPVTTTALRRFILPFDNQGDFSTSMAIANLSNNAAGAISIVVRNQNGVESVRRQLTTLPIRGHTAFELRINIPETSGNLGTVEFTSTTDVAVVGLRFDNSQGILTSFDPLPLDQSPKPRQSLAQVADGGMFRTSITLVNLDTTEAPYTIRLRASNGSMWNIGLVGGSDPLSGSIPVGGVRVIRTAGNGNVMSGWAEVSSSRNISGLAVYRQRLANGSEQEAAVQMNPVGIRRFLLPFDNSSGFTTSLALANLDLSRATAVHVVIRDEAGSEIERRDLDVLPLQGHTAFELKARFPGSRDRRGVAEFTTDTEVSVVGLRFNDVTGAFTSFRSVQ